MIMMGCALFPNKPNLISTDSDPKPSPMGLIAIVVSLALGSIVGFLGVGFAALSLCSMVCFLISLRDYRVGIYFATLLLPLSGTIILPREMFGIIGINPLNLTLGVSILSIVYFLIFRPDEIKIPLFGSYFFLYISAFAFSTAMGAFNVTSIPAYFKVLKIINFSDAAGYVRDIFFKPMIIIVTTFLLAIAIRNAPRPRSYLYALLASSLILPLVVIGYIFNSHMSLQLLSSSGSREFLSGIGMHANELGLLFNMGFALALFSFRGVTGVAQKWMFGLATIILMAASVLTFSRGAFLGLLVVMGYFLYALKHFKHIFIGLALLPILFSLLPAPVVERAATGANNNDIGEISAGRVDHIWRPLLPEVLSSPVIGRGMSSIMWTQAARNGAILRVGHPHNAYLGVALDMGLLGALVVIIFFRHMWKVFMDLAFLSHDPVWRAYFRGACACVLLLLVQGVTDDRFTPTFAQTFLWLSYGIAKGLMSRPNEIRRNDNISGSSSDVISAR